MPRAASTSSASTPTTTTGSSCRSRSTSGSRSRSVPTDDRRVDVTLAGDRRARRASISTRSARGRGPGSTTSRAPPGRWPRRGQPVRGFRAVARVRPADGRGAVVVGGARAGVGPGAVGGAAPRPLDRIDARAARPARRERVRRRPVRADGPVRVRLRRGRAARCCSTAARSSIGAVPLPLDGVRARRVPQRLAAAAGGVGLQRAPRRVRARRSRRSPRSTRRDRRCAT